MFGKREELNAHEVAVVAGVVDGLAEVLSTVPGGLESLVRPGTINFHNATVAVMPLVKVRIGAATLFRFCTDPERMIRLATAWNKQFPDLFSGSATFDPDDRDAVERHYAFFAYHIDKRGQN